MREDRLGGQELQDLLEARAYRLWTEHGRPQGGERAYWELAGHLVAAEDELGRALAALRERLDAGLEPALHDRLLPSAYPNMSAGRPATTSSRSHWTVAGLEEDASRATVADVAPGFTFHTAFEQMPWWRVDLEQAVAIERIRIYNRTDMFEGAVRFNRFAIQVSDDDADWRTIFEKTDDRVVGGAIGDPFVWIARDPVAARFVRLQLPGHGALHLNRIDIHGCAAVPAPNAAAPADGQPHDR